MSHRSASDHIPRPNRRTSIRGILAALLAGVAVVLFGGCGSNPREGNAAAPVASTTASQAQATQTINLTLTPGSSDTPSTVKGSLGSDSVALRVGYPEDVLSGNIGKARAAIRWPANSTPQSVSGTVGDLPTRVTLVQTKDWPQEINRITGTIGPDALNARSALAVPDSGSGVGLVVKGTLAADPAMTYALLVTCALGTYALDFF